MEQDLTQLQTRYVDTLLNSERRENAPAGKDDHHGDAGAAFQIFKQAFSESKVAMFHLLLPKNVCDKEAYSQLIYAACLQVFRRSFPSQLEAPKTEASLEHAAFALFSLYALYETNPLPRKTKTPLELLPMGLQEEENFRALYRRAFLQNIRIDKEHYSLLLQLKELSLARIEACGESFYQVQLVELHSWKCNCSIARSTLQVLSRLSTKWEYCDYTGPVGLEGLAGHADYTTFTTQQPSRQLLGVESEESSLSKQELELTNTLKLSMQNYHSRVKGIRIPQEKFRTATLLRNELGSFFGEIHKEPWSRVESRLYGTVVDNESDTETGSASGSLRRPEKTSHNVGTLGQDPSQVLDDGVTTSASGDKNATPSFKTVMPRELNHSTSARLQQALELLFRREGPVVLSSAQQEGSKSAADDISSIGIGGISVATGRGRSALQALLSRANTNKGIPVRVRAVPKQVKQEEAADSNSAVMFLNADQAFSQTKSDGDDDDSVVSNLSLSDYNEDHIGSRDDTSAATSAAGKQALATLLKQVKKKTKTTQPQRLERKREMTLKKKPTQPPECPASVASSVGQGLSALGGLLDSVAHGVLEKPICRNSVRSEGTSCASSIGQGQDALGMLLSTASRQLEAKTKTSKRSRSKHDTTGERKRNRREDTSHPQKRSNQKDKDDAGSLASSVGEGRGALGALLAQAGQKTPRNSKS